MTKLLRLNWLLLTAAVFSAALPCPGDDGPPAGRENRFLFVVDTSHAMRQYSNEVVNDVLDLMGSDMRGEFRKGDTIGLWTYNDKLDPQFPMQVWSKSNRDAMADDMAAFLRGRPYEKQAHLERVMPLLNKVIKGSERITIIVIFDGSGIIQGTPFDKDIHVLLKKYARELRKAHLPVVLALAARDGAVFDYTINFPGSVAIPHTAYPEPPPVATNAPAVVVVAPPVVKPPPKVRGSIIMSRANTLIQSAPSAPAPTPQVVVVTAPKPPPAAPAPAPTPAAPVVPATPPAVATTPPPAHEAATVPPPTNVTPAEQQPPPAPPIPEAAPVAVAAVQPAGGSAIWLFVVALLLLTTAVLLLLFLLRRSKGAPQPSLISQSIDRPR